jgi:hypothetical protein
VNWLRRSRRALPLGLAVALFVAFSIVYAQTPSNSRAPKPRTRRQPAGMFDLQVARLYESLNRWNEAEQEYIQAGRIGAPCVKKEALAAIERLKIHRPSDEENFEFELGTFYEDDHAWKEAEQHYASAAKDAPKPVRDLVLARLKNVHEHQSLAEWFEDFDRWLGYVARVLGAAFLLVILWRIVKVWGAIEVKPFEASSDEAVKRAAFALSSAREGLPQVIGPVLATMRTNVVDVMPMIILPGLENAFLDPAEDLEVGEIKVPLANWIRMIKRPAIRVFGRWNVGGVTGIAQARILRRRYFVYRESSFSRFTVPSAAGDPQDRQLSLFAYDVLVRAVFSKLYGP